MIYLYRSVDRIPEKLSEGIVYHNEDFEIASLLCACGCGHKVDLLVPDGHQIISKDGLATINPSIAVCDANCKSHYFIRAGRVEWLPPFTSTEARSVMINQIARHVERDSRPVSFRDRIIIIFTNVGKWIKSIFRR